MLFKKKQRKQKQDNTFKKHTIKRDGVAVEVLYTKTYVALKLR